MNVNAAFKIASELCKQFEGFHKVRKSDGLALPYICPAGYWTIGYGTLCSKSHLPIHKGEAELYLYRHLAKDFSDLIRYSPNIFNATDGQVAALLSFVYNLGISRYRSSTLRRRVNEGDWESAKNELQKWTYGGGKKLPGLVARRKVEARMM